VKIGRPLEELRLPIRFATRPAMVTNQIRMILRDLEIMDAPWRVVTLNLFNHKAGPVAPNQYARRGDCLQWHSAGLQYLSSSSVFCIL